MLNIDFSGPGKNELVKEWSGVYANDADILKDVESYTRIFFPNQTNAVVISECRNMVHPKYKTRSVREGTFARCWPPSIPVKPDELAAAGFYYTGMGDKVSCFYCGISLMNWKRGDKAMTEHYKYSPNCSYAKLYDCFRNIPPLRFQCG